MKVKTLDDFMRGEIIKKGVEKNIGSRTL